jgi:predicted Mrr-cat superfamily restriction endonuclease
MQKKRVRSAKHATILRMLADKYGFTQQYIRVCVKGHSDSEKSEEIRADYKKVEKQLNNLSKTI